MIQQPPSGVPCEGCSRVCTMLVIGSALQVAACRGRRLHTVSGRPCSSRTLCPPSLARDGGERGALLPSPPQTGGSGKHTAGIQSPPHLACRLLPVKKKNQS